MSFAAKTQAAPAAALQKRSSHISDAKQTLALFRSAARYIDRLLALINDAIMAPPPFKDLHSHANVPYVS
jgi:hypothetical protein